MQCDRGCLCLRGRDCGGRSKWGRWEAFTKSTEVEIVLGSGQGLWVEVLNRLAFFDSEGSESSGTPTVLVELGLQEVDLTFLVLLVDQCRCIGRHGLLARHLVLLEWFYLGKNIDVTNTQGRQHEG